jgi:hypothetical protein
MTMLVEYPHHLLENLGEIYSVIKTLTPTQGKTAQDSLLEVRCAIEEVFSVSRSSKTDGRMPVARELMKLAARCIVEAAQLGARDEYEVRQWADLDKVKPEDELTLGSRPPKPNGKSKTKA